MTNVPNLLGNQTNDTMFTAASSRRLTVVSRILNTPKPYMKRTSAGLETYRLASTKTQVTIGDVSKDVSEPKNPEYVPIKYLKAKESQHTLRHLRWMLQKDLLGQDMFLMGRPGPARRRLAMQFLQVTGRELEFVALSRDTTEADLKQRREIQNGSSKYFDQSAVRAAVEGRVLILEGVEKAERNVLPVLNNLLENREMHLEDGRFLIPASRYDKLLKEHSEEELKRWQLVRVSDDFRVIALGLPVPKYQGNPLDPPLRSRFQARFIDTESFKELQEELLQDVPHADRAQVGQLLSCCFSLLSPEAAALAIPDFPSAALPALVKLLGEFPDLPLHALLTRAYPYRSMLGQDGVRAVEDLLATFQVTEPERPLELRVGEVSDTALQHKAAVTISYGGSSSQVEVSRGAGDGGTPPPKFVETPYQESLLAQLMQSHVAADLCVIGPRGCGKSATVRQLAATLGYTIEPIVLFQDMTSRDLVQQRTTLPNGDTVWYDSPLVSAALNGHLAVLDGLHRVHPGTLAVIHRLSQDRELQLHDGRRLLRDDRYEELRAKMSWTEEQMAAAGVQKIHPSFRIVALAEPPSSGKGSTQWLTPELLNLFLFHEMRPLSSQEELSIITNLYGKPSYTVESVVEVAHNLRESEDPTLRAIAPSLSTRQLLRIARRMASFPSDASYDAVQRASLARFLPNIARQSLEKLLSSLNVERKKELDGDAKSADCVIINGDSITIGGTTAKRYPDTAAKSKVPDILFYDVPQHIILLEALLQDFVLGEHLLLVGNQGVGKNKVADRLLQILNRPREYIQLHRDTTVQTLTLQPTVRDGIVVYDDSPLVTAVKLGHVLVVDEADKAPTHVTCILKTLVESGEMILSDGRRIVPSNDIRASSPTPNIIPIHPDFRMIVLANRPGFPFLGNDFFGSLGDLFSCHSVDNPSPESERALLKSYGPDVPDALIEKLVKAFGELRNMADQGLVNYPYSTREVVNIVKHLQKFPNEGLANVVSNVFDFDQHSKETLETLVSVLHKHGIPVGAKPTNVSLATELPLPPLKQVAQWLVIQTQISSLGVEERFLKTKRPVSVPHEIFNVDKVEARSTFFSEMQSYWNMPVNESTIISGLAVTKGSNFAEDLIHVATVNPLGVLTMSPYKDKALYLSMQGLLGSNRFSRSQVSIIALDGFRKGSILVHEESSNSLVLLDTENKLASAIPVASLLDQATEKISQRFGGGRQQTGWKMVPGCGSNNVILYEKDGSKIDLINIDNMTAHSLAVPFDISSLHVAGSDTWLLSDSEQRRYSLKKQNINDNCPSILRIMHQEGTESDSVQVPIGAVIQCDSTGLGSKALSEALDQKISAPNRLLSTSKSLATVVVGFPDLDLTASEVYSWKREHGVSSKSTAIVMSDIGQIVRPIRVGEVPPAIAQQNDEGLAGYLEVVDVVNHKMRFVPVPEPKVSSTASAYVYSNSQQPILIAERSNSGLVTVDKGGCVRLWETGLAQLERSLDDWQKMLGTGRDDLQLTVDRYSGLDVSNPKHGKVDKNNDPHVGGNTWAGGTGGRDTAGLGGKGGPYRLDAGHKVHQLSDAEKEAIPEHVKKAAREMGQRAFQQRLKEIQMSSYDATLYEQFHKGVSKQIQSLRVVLSSLQAKSKERQWLRHQTSGELDDTKLIEGLTGEKTIYRRRAEAEPELGAPQMKPKRLRLVVDVSGSMYRFNGYDGRLDREMEAMVLVMEAFQGHEDKILYDIHGHSGEGYGIEFVDSSKPPKDNKQRLDVIKTMHAHAQFCMSGDHTLAATKTAISSLAQEDCDDAIVVVLSDANLERYGIPPKRFASALTEETKVNAYAIFIGSLGDQAAKLTKQMPAGRAFVCMDLKDIPQILQQIFTASMLNTA